MSDGWVAHAAAFENAARTFGAEPATLEIAAVADVSAAAAKDFARRFGVPRWSTDWRELLDDTSIDAADITTPNDAHPEVALAAAKVGKQIYCEKPMANTASEAKAMRDAAKAAGIVTLVAERGYKRVLAAPQHPDYAAFFGLQGNPLGYNDLKIIEARRLIEAIASRKPWIADFEFGYAFDRVVEAALVSADERRWVKTEEIA